jgi:DnaJ-class molecular chaperone
MQQIAPGFVQQVQQRDERCVARGKMWSSGCRACPNGQTQSEKIDLTIDLQKGMYAGEPITFEGVADETPGVSKVGSRVWFVSRLIVCYLTSS